MEVSVRVQWKLVERWMNKPNNMSRVSYGAVTGGKRNGCCSSENSLCAQLPWLKEGD